MSIFRKKYWAVFSCAAGACSAEQSRRLLRNERIAYQAPAGTCATESGPGTVLYTVLYMVLLYVIWRLKMVPYLRSLF